MLDLRRLRLLRELARRGTIAAVAEAFSYSPSAVSQQLATLERETGVRLLEPAGRRVRLTAAAEVLVEHADRLLEEMERAEAALAASQADVSGRVRVAAFQSAVLTLLPEALLTLAARHPELRVEATEQEPETALPALAAGEFDLVLGEEYPGHPQARPPGIERHDLTRDTLRLAVPAGWAERSLAALVGRRFVMEPFGTAAREWATGLCRQAGFEPDVVHTSTDLQIHLRLVETGLVAALLPALSGLDGRPGVASLPLPGHPSRQIFVSVRRGMADDPRIRAVRDALPH